MVTKTSRVVTKMIKKSAVVKNFGVTFSFHVKRTQREIGAE